MAFLLFTRWSFILSLTCFSSHMGAIKELGPYSLDSSLHFLLYVSPGLKHQYANDSYICIFSLNYLSPTPD